MCKLIGERLIDIRSVWSGNFDFVINCVTNFKFVFPLIRFYPPPPFFQSRLRIWYLWWNTLVIKLLLINALSAMSTPTRFAFSVIRWLSKVNHWVCLHFGNVLPGTQMRIRWFSPDGQRIAEISNGFNASAPRSHVDQRRVKASSWNFVLFK